MEPPDQPIHDRVDALDERRLAPRAIGKAGIVRDIDQLRVRPRAQDLGEDGEPPEAGIEDEDGGTTRHALRQMAGERSIAASGFKIDLHACKADTASLKDRCGRPWIVLKF